MKCTISSPYPLGATLDNTGCNFAIHAPANKQLLLALFDQQGSFTTHELENEYAGVKYTHVPNIKAGQKYGYLILNGDEPHYISDP